MDLTNVKAIQIFAHLYNVVHKLEIDENKIFYPEKFIEILNLKFDDAQINDLLNLSKGLSYRKAAKISNRKISHVSMKTFEESAAFDLNTSHYFRHFFKDENDDYDFKTSTAEVLKDEIRLEVTYAMTREIKDRYDLDVEKIKDFRFFIKYHKYQFDNYLKFLRSFEYSPDLDPDVIRLGDFVQINFNREKIRENWSTVLAFKLKDLEEKFEKEPMTIEDITRLVKIAMNDRSAKVYLFGSHARNQASIYSDIDLVVESSDALLTLDLMGTIEEMIGDGESFKCQAITMKQLYKADEEFRKSVETDMVLIYDK